MDRSTIMQKENDSANCSYYLGRLGFDWRKELVCFEARLKIMPNNNNSTTTSGSNVSNKSNKKGSNTNMQQHQQRPLVETQVNKIATRIMELGMWIVVHREESGAPENTVHQQQQQQSRSQFRFVIVCKRSDKDAAISEIRSNFAEQLELVERQSKSNSDEISRDTFERALMRYVCFSICHKQRDADADLFTETTTTTATSSSSSSQSWHRLASALSTNGYGFAQTLSFFDKNPALVVQPTTTNITRSISANRINMEMNVTEDGALFLKLGTASTRFSPFKKTSIAVHQLPPVATVDSEDFYLVKLYEEMSEDDSTLCFTLPGCHPALIVGLGKRPPRRSDLEALSSLVMRNAYFREFTEDDIRQHWSDVYGWTLPEKLDYALVYGPKSKTLLTYPTCCLLSGEPFTTTTYYRKSAAHTRSNNNNPPRDLEAEFIAMLNNRIKIGLKRSNSTTTRVIYIGDDVQGGTPQKYDIVCGFHKAIEMSSAGSGMNNLVPKSAAAATEVEKSIPKTFHTPTVVMKATKKVVAAAPNLLNKDSPLSTTPSAQKKNNDTIRGQNETKEEKEEVAQNKSTNTKENKKQPAESKTTSGQSTKKATSITTETKQLEGATTTTTKSATKTKKRKHDDNADEGDNNSTSEESQNSATPAKTATQHGKDDGVTPEASQESTASTAATKTCSNKNNKPKKSKTTTTAAAASDQQGDRGLSQASTTSGTTSTTTATTTPAQESAKKQLQDLISLGKIQSQTVPQLKELLKQLGLKVSGKKDELIARLQQHNA